MLPPFCFTVVHGALLFMFRVVFVPNVAFKIMAKFKFGFIRQKHTLSQFQVFFYFLLRLLVNMKLLSLVFQNQANKNII